MNEGYCKREPCFYYWPWKLQASRWQFKPHSVKTTSYFSQGHYCHIIPTHIFEDLTLRMATRLRSLAGNTGRTIPSCCKKCACVQAASSVSPARLQGSCSLTGVSRERLGVPEVCGFIWVCMWVQDSAVHVFSISCYLLHLCIFGWAASIVPGRVWDCGCLASQ